MDTENIGMTHPLDLLDPADFKSTGDYLAAAADLQLKHERPEFLGAYNKMVTEYGNRRMKEAREASHEEYARILRNTTLDSNEMKAVKAQAAEKVQADLTAQRIFPADMVDKTAQYVDELTKQAVLDKARRTHFNTMFRAAAGVN